MSLRRQDERELIGLEVFRVERGAGVDVDGPQDAGPGVLEGVWNARWGDEEIARPGDDRLVAEREGRLALEDQEDLLVGVLVQVRPTAWRHRLVVDDGERRAV